MSPVGPYDKQGAQKTNNEIWILNALTKFRLRLRETTGIEPSLNNSTELLYKSKLDVRCGPTTSKPIERRRRERSAFVFVATELGNATSKLLDAHIESIDDIDGVESESYNEGVLRDYFARVKNILPTVNQELADKLNDSWSQINPIPLPPLEPIDLEDLDTAGVKKTVRHLAEETKRRGSLR